MVLMTTGGGPAAYSGRGVNPSLNAILAPIQHGVFWFNGFRTLEPFIAWGAARVSDQDRVQYLEQLKSRLQGIFDEVPIELPPLAEFPQFGPDTKKRFKVVVSRKQAADDAYRARISEERARVAELRRTGFVLEDVFSPADAEVWRGFLTVRARSEEEVQEKLATLPLAYNLNFEIHELG
jgi:muconolactone delta-isomerase